MPRVLLTERSQQRHHFKPPERDRRIDAQPPDRRHACTAEHPFGLLPIRQAAAATIKKAAPSTVKLTRRVVPANSRSSSRLIALLTPDRVTPSFSAARA